MGVLWETGVYYLLIRWERRSLAYSEEGGDWVGRRRAVGVWKSLKGEWERKIGRHLKWLLSGSSEGETFLKWS